MKHLLDQWPSFDKGKVNFLKLVATAEVLN